MRESCELIISPIFKGITRPTMMLGVTLEYFIINLIACSILFIASSQILLTLFLSLGFHIGGMILCYVDYQLMSVIASNLRCVGVTNYKYWGCASYEPF